MKECTVFWVGQSQSGHKYLGIQYAEGDFLCKKFIRLLDEVDLGKYQVGSEIKVPAAALA